MILVRDDDPRNGALGAELGKRVGGERDGIDQVGGFGNGEGSRIELRFDGRIVDPPKTKARGNEFDFRSNRHGLGIIRFEEAPLKTGFKRGIEGRWHRSC